jgi:hypothetical protein
MTQETLEEVAENYAKKWNDLENQFKLSSCFIEGAKYQQEQMYSEEEVMNMFHNLSMHLPLHYEFLVKEQFKNK